jgi:hypothetical protein
MGEQRLSFGRFGEMVAGPTANGRKIERGGGGL